MTNLQDLINLAKADGGKFFVIDENGEVKLVIMRVEEYQRLFLNKLQRQVLDVEKVNKEIIRAQIQEPEIRKPVQPPPAPKSNRIPQVDMRAEVIDPSFDFEGPKTDLEDL